MVGSKFSVMEVTKRAYESHLVLLTTFQQPKSIDQQPHLGHQFLQICPPIDFALFL